MKSERACLSPASSLGAYTQVSIVATLHLLGESNNALPPAQLSPNLLLTNKQFAATAKACRHLCNLVVFRDLRIHMFSRVIWIEVTIECCKWLQLIKPYMPKCFHHTNYIIMRSKGHVLIYTIDIIWGLIFSLESLILPRQVSP